MIPLLMRIVILINPTLAVESATNGPKFAEKSIGFDYEGSAENNNEIAHALSEIVKVLRTPTVPDLELI
jgi:hypothetical protein